jgi:transposase
MNYCSIDDKREIDSSGKTKYILQGYFTDLTLEQRAAILPLLEQMKALMDAENRIEREKQLNEGKTVPLKDRMIPLLKRM